MSISINPFGWEKILEIMKRERPIEEFPRWYEPIAHMHTCLEFRMTNPWTMKTESYDVLGLPAATGDLDMVKYLVDYFRRTMGTGNVMDRRNLLLIAEKACKAAAEWQAYRCWAYLRCVAREEKPHCQEFARYADDLRPAIFYAMESNVGTKYFKKLIDDGFCDLDETHEGMTPLEYAVARQPAYAEILSAVVGVQA